MCERHAPIKYLLQCLDHNLMERMGIFFGGGTAIALRLDEFRVSVDIDLYCRDDKALYAARHIAVEDGAGSFFTTDIPVTLTRVDRDGLKFFVSVGPDEIKCEIFHLGLFPITGEKVALFPVPTLTPYELFTAKLFANANRFMDARYQHKDIIDLGAMLNAWGDMPSSVWKMAYDKYGQEDIDGAFQKSVRSLISRKELWTAADALSISPSVIKTIAKALTAKCRRLEMEKNNRKKPYPWG